MFMILMTSSCLWVTRILRTLFWSDFVHYNCRYCHLFYTLFLLTRFQSTFPPPLFFSLSIYLSIFILYTDCMVISLLIVSLQIIFLRSLLHFWYGKKIDKIVLFVVYQWCNSWLDYRPTWCFLTQSIGKVGNPLSNEPIFSQSSWPIRLSCGYSDILEKGGRKRETLIWWLPYIMMCNTWL